MGEWYYIGHYGQLGPLTREQIDELVWGEVIARDTYVWKTGMPNWIPAGQVPDLMSLFQRAPELDAPPPPPMVAPNLGPPAAPVLERSPAFASFPHTYGALKSDKSRVLAGLLQILLPGVGRMYLGYSAFGVLQLIFALCGVGYIWSFIDGFYILAGGLKMDGYGRQLGQ